MKFRLKLPLKGFHRWYAWHPVCVSPYSERKWVWLEWIERERDWVDGGLLGYQYREIGSRRSDVGPLSRRCYVMSEPHLNGYRLVVGFNSLDDVHIRGLQSPVATLDEACAKAWRHQGTVHVP